MGDMRGRGRGIPLLHNQLSVIPRRLTNQIDSRFRDFVFKSTPDGPSGHPHLWKKRHEQLLWTLFRRRRPETPGVSIHIHAFKNGYEVITFCRAAATWLHQLGRPQLLLPSSNSALFAPLLHSFLQKKWDFNFLIVLQWIESMLQSKSLKASLGGLPEAESSVLSHHSRHKLSQKLAVVSVESKLSKQRDIVALAEKLEHNWSHGAGKLPSSTLWNLSKIKLNC